METSKDFKVVLLGEGTNAYEPNTLAKERRLQAPRKWLEILSHALLSASNGASSFCSTDTDTSSPFSC